jgi:hypothetical protein
MMLTAFMNGLLEIDGWMVEGWMADWVVEKVNGWMVG